MDVSKARTRMFIMAVCIGLASGSNYVYSGYAPQLAANLDITSTDSNLVGLGGNLGMYLTGPIWGMVVDRRGPQLPLLCGALLNFVGYSTVRAFYNGAIPIRTAPDQPASRPLVFLLALFMFMTGSAGSAGLTSGMNAVAKSYPDRSRAAYTGAVLAGFGLSAFLFSMLGHAIFHGEAGGLLLLLSIGTSVPHLVGSFIVRAYPPEGEGEGEEDGVHDGDDLDPEEECALARQVSLGASAEGQVLLRRSSELERALEFELSDDAAPPSSSDPLMRRRSPVKHSRTDSTASLPPTKIHFTPLEAMKQTDFHLIFSVLAILCGVGLEWINNVGAVTLALARDGWDYDPRAVAAYQARQVATISVFNCLGRVLGGICSDALKLRFGIKRVWFLPLVALGFLGSEIAVLYTERVDHLWMVSASLGLSYGALFNVLPMLVLEWFGMTYFSSNWGFTSTAPILGGNVFNLVFGRVYDSNTVGRIGGAPEAHAGAGVGSGVNLVRSAGRVDTRAAAVAAAAAAAIGDPSDLGGTTHAAAAEVVAVARAAAQSGWTAASRSVGSALGRAGAGSAAAAALARRVADTTAAASVEPVAAAAAASGSADREHECLLGPACYAAAFRISVLGVLLALALSVVAGVRRERAARASRSQARVAAHAAGPSHLHERERLHVPEPGTSSHA